MELNLDEIQLEREVLYDGKILRLERDRVKLPNGNTAWREICRHPGGVCVLAVTPQGEVLFVRQFRYAYGTTLLELPAGELEPGEEPLPAALRELEEETGYQAAKLHYMGEMYPTPGCMDEVLHLYYGDDLQKTQAHPDEDEFLELVKIPLEQALEMVFAGELPDAKTQLALLRYQLTHQD